MTIGIVATLTLVCASTDPNKAQSDDDFAYNPDMSFAMNVVTGSLGFHNSSKTSGALDYTSSGIIVSAFGVGMGDALLSILGTNQGNKPLHTYYGIVYYPITQNGSSQ
ncbi:hypothetical protein GCM10011607_12170 [Shewanella inventionis]|uniref:Uncharacterized protein n=1 Tax=Shewanella inventionis TaxID=1738770 RepID=A0ABQ1IV29_9GAMM|nr:hypothetical protein [Shewanella inventionis]GGB53215.1 hypothetical protein GCM10011607_12170 [Shewanella inventionis]